MINYRKLNRQIRPTKAEAWGRGYIFIPTEEQAENGLIAISCKTRRHLNRCMLAAINLYEEYREEFTY